MILRELKDRLLAIPWVYDNVRPLMVGGLDLRILAEFCGISENDRVFDLGCGTAQLLQHLKCSHYLGVDLDPSALARAYRFSGPHTRFHSGADWEASYRDLRPTVALMIGVVHHVPDNEFREIADRLWTQADSLRRIVTIDVSYFEGMLINNLMSRLDRGRHVRKPEEYENLFLRCNMRVTLSRILPTTLGYVRYVGYYLERLPEGAEEYRLPGK